MANYGLEVETTTHLKGMQVVGNQPDSEGGGIETVSTFSHPISYFLSSDKASMLVTTNDIPEDIIANGYYGQGGLWMLEASTSMDKLYYGFAYFSGGGAAYPSSVKRIYVAKSLECYNTINTSLATFVDEPLNFGGLGIWRGCLHLIHN